MGLHVQIYASNNWFFSNKFLCPHGSSNSFVNITVSVAIKGPHASSIWEFCNWGFFGYLGPRVNMLKNGFSLNCNLAHIMFEHKLVTNELKCKSTESAYLLKLSIWNPVKQEIRDVLVRLSRTQILKLSFYNTGDHPVPTVTKMSLGPYRV